ncbi:DUF354 domain-containing protein [Halomarina litorea]|uniref:DUF354 domain-containing protein n=1 Tax=Halomarina litorea TaxID=2961595 RepID=UPI00211519CD|nr:DUF354 domain-containing protein [Halomarina sp. BCD28]
MKYLVFVNTPAHAHTYRHLARTVVDSEDEMLVLARDYSCTLDILDYHDVPYEVYGSHKTSDYSTFGFARELPQQFFRIARHVRRYDPDVIFGRGPYAAFASLFCDARVILLLDAEPSELLHRASSPFADLILTPEATDIDLGKNHYVFKGFKECGYLLPDVFTPDPTVREDLGLEPDERFMLVRFASLDALHDRDAVGRTIEQRRQVIEAAPDDVTVLVSDESGELDLEALGARKYDLHPARIHDVMAEADLLVAETGTMVIEAAFLGTPAIACSDWANQGPGEFVALEDAGLIRITSDLERVAEHVSEILGDPDAQARYQQRRDEFLADKVDLTELLMDVARDPAFVSERSKLRPRRSTPV